MKNFLLAIFGLSFLLIGFMIGPIKEHLPGFNWVMGIAFVVLLFNFKKGWKYFKSVRNSLLEKEDKQRRLR